MSRFVHKSIRVIYGLLFGWTVFLILGLQAVTDYNCAKEFVLENAGYLLIGGALAFLLYRINVHWGEAIEQFLARYSRAILFCSLVILGGVLIYCSYGAYFVSGWDASKVRETVFHELYGEYDQIEIGYFEVFRNNNLLIWIYLQVVQFARLCGMQNLEFAPVILQCILAVITMGFVWSITYDYARSYRVAWLAYVAAWLFVGLSPWYLVPYSDATGMIFPVLVIRLYQRERTANRRAVRGLYLFLIGLVSAIGFHIKPQIVIVLIAITILELGEMVGRRIVRRAVRFVARALVCAAGFLLITGIYYSAIEPSLHYSYIHERFVGWQHYVMMGMNYRTDGTYADEDMLYIVTIEEDLPGRNQIELQEARNRAQILGVSGMARHLCRKQLVNYGDGTFAWAVEGNWYMEHPDWARNAVSDLAEEVILPEGEYYQLFLSSKQLLWVMILVLQLAAVWYGRRTQNEAVHLMMLSLVGLTIFNLLFEARARYLFCYAPVYVILAVAGFVQVARAVRRYIRISGR